MTHYNSVIVVMGRSAVTSISSPLLPIALLLRLHGVSEDAADPRRQHPRPNMPCTTAHPRLTSIVTHSSLVKAGLVASQAASIASPGPVVIPVCPRLRLVRKPGLANRQQRIMKLVIFAPYGESIITPLENS